MLVVVILLWAGNSIVGRALRDDIGPFTLAFLRWTVAFGVLIPFTWSKVQADWPVIVQRWPTILLLGLIGIGMFNALLYSGLRETTATNALLIQAAIPTLVLAFDFAFFRARPSAMQVAGVALAAAGVAVIVFQADPRHLLSLRFGRGDLIVLAACVAWALYTALLRLRPPMAPEGFLAITFLIGAAAMLPFAAFELRTIPIHASPALAGALAYVAIFPSVIGYLMYNRAVIEIGAADAGQVISLQPLFGAFLAAALLGEALHAWHFAGMALILLGIALPLLRRQRETAAA